MKRSRPKVPHLRLVPPLKKPPKRLARPGKELEPAPPREEPPRRLLFPHEEAEALEKARAKARWGTEKPAPPPKDLFPESAEGWKKLAAFVETVIDAKRAEDERLEAQRRAWILGTYGELRRRQAAEAARVLALESGEPSSSKKGDTGGETELRASVQARTAER